MYDYSVLQKLFLHVDNNSRAIIRETRKRKWTKQKVTEIIQIPWTAGKKHGHEKKCNFKEEF